jgi:hypothetical protein
LAITCNEGVKDSKMARRTAAHARSNATLQRRWIAAMLALPLLAALAFAARPAHALTVEVSECREGADFIRNAAFARENGMSKESFVARLDADLQFLLAVPEELRWFAHGESEAEFLREAVERVYDAPVAPMEHGVQFAKACLIAAGHAKPDALDQFDLPDAAKQRAPSAQESKEYWRNRT